MGLLVDSAYVVAASALLPAWLWRLPRARRYRAGLAQRLGLAPRLPQGPRVWIHCASVGEAAIPGALVAGLQARHPTWDVVFSTNTDTGADRLRELYPGATVFYMPLDFSACVRATFRRVRPSLVLLVELEVWPNFLEVCRDRGVPVGIVNGRIGTGSRRSLRALSRLCRRLWEPVRVCCARSRDDAEGFVSAGMPPERVFDCGSLKYDALRAGPDAEEVARLRALFGFETGAPVLVAGSTHAGEEAVLGAAYANLRRKHPGLRMVVVPRHVERAAEAVAELEGEALPVVRKTALDGGRAVAGGDEVIVLDTVGELAACYGLAACAFVGRSLVPPGGGQNMMEPVALGLPVVVGPHTGNFKPEMALLRRANGIVEVQDGAGLEAALGRLLGDPATARRVGDAGRAVIEASRGATQRTLDRLAPLLR